MHINVRTLTRFTDVAHADAPHFAIENAEPLKWLENRRHWTSCEVRCNNLIGQKSRNSI